MSYSPNNIYLYVSAYSGAISGFCGSGRQPSDLDSDVYDALCAQAGAWAQEYDTYFWNNTELPYDVLTITASQTLSEETFAGRASNALVNPAVFTSLSGGITAILTAAEAYFAEQGIDIPAWPPGGSGVTWSNDLSGSTDTDQIVSQSSGSTTGLFPIFGPPYGETDITAAIGIVPGETSQSALYLFPQPGTALANNWVIKSEGGNLVIEAVDADGTVGFFSPIGGQPSYPLQETDALITMTSTGVTTLSAAQIQSPSLTVDTVSIGDAGATLDFAVTEVTPGVSSAYYDLDLSSVTTNGNAFTLANGAAPTIALTELLPYNTQFRVKCATNVLEIEPSPLLVGLSVDWASDLLGSSNDSQKVVSLSGATVIPTLDGDTITAAIGLQSTGTLGALYLFGTSGSYTPDSNNWSMAGDGLNTYLSANGGTVQVVESSNDEAPLVIMGKGSNGGAVTLAQTVGDEDLAALGYFGGAPGGGELHLFAVGAGQIPTADSWSLSANATNLVVNGPVSGGAIEFSLASDISLAKLNAEQFEIGPALAGLAPGAPLTFALSTVALTSGETTVLTTAQQQTPVIAISPITLDGATTLDFGGPTVPAGQGALYDLDLSNVVTAGFTLTIQNGTADNKIEIQDYINPPVESGAPNLFRVLLQEGTLSISS